MNIKKVKKWINIVGISVGIIIMLLFYFGMILLSFSLDPQFVKTNDIFSQIINGLPILLILFLPLAAWIKLVLGISGFIEEFIRGYRGDKKENSNG